MERPYAKYPVHSFFRTRMGCFIFILFFKFLVWFQIPHFHPRSSTGTGQTGERIDELKATTLVTIIAASGRMLICAARFFI